MSRNLKQTFISSIRDASWYETGKLTAPVVVQWPDPKEQWSSVIAILQEDMTELIPLPKLDHILATQTTFEDTGSTF